MKVVCTPVTSTTGVKVDVVLARHKKDERHARKVRVRVIPVSERRNRAEELESTCEIVCEEIICDSCEETSECAEDIFCEAAQVCAEEEGCAEESCTAEEVSAEEEEVTTVDELLDCCGDAAPECEVSDDALDLSAPFTPEEVAADYSADSLTDSLISMLEEVEERESPELAEEEDNAEEAAPSDTLGENVQHRHFNVDCDGRRINSTSDNSQGYDTVVMDGEGHPRRIIGKIVGGVRVTAPAETAEEE